MLRRIGRLISAFLLLPTMIEGSGNSLPIVDAARARDLTALRALVQRHVDVNVSEPDGSTALHWAAHKGDVEAVDLLLRAGARAHTANRYGITPLSLASETGNATVVVRLIAGGADPNTAADGGETVLMTAARTGRTGVVRALIQAGADVNARERTRGQTALMWAATEGHAEIVRVLLEHGADIAAKSHGPSSSKEITEGYGAFRRVAPRIDSCTPLQFAVQAGQIEATRALLDAGADIHVETPQGMGLLTLAIANAHFDVAALLIERGADVNHAKIGWSPLHQVVRVRTLNIGSGPPHPRASGRLTGVDVAELLLKHGANVDARTTRPWQDGYRGTFALQATPLLLAAKGGDTDMMWLLASHGADMMATNVNGTTVLMMAAGLEMFNPNEDSGRDVDGLAALKLALRLGAGEIDAANKQGNTALHGAIARVSPDAAKLLIENGAKLDVKNRNGLTPIEIAVNGSGIVGGRPETATVLREAMLARGLPLPEARDVSKRYNFGVKVKDDR